MTNFEVTNNRPSFLSKWNRVKLLDWQNDNVRFYVIDKDWTYINEDTKRIINVEEKIGDKEIPYHQALHMKIISEAMSDWCKKNGYIYDGYHVFRLLPDGFSWDGKNVSEDELINLLSLGSKKKVVEKKLEDWW